MAPILDLSDELGVKYPNYSTSWHLINCSITATARNVFVKLWIDTNESKPILLYAMSPNTKIELPWIKQATRIQIIYSDAAESKYYRFIMTEYRGNNTQITKMEFQLGIAGYLSSTNIIRFFDEEYKRMGRGVQ